MGNYSSYKIRKEKTEKIINKMLNEYNLLFDNFNKRLTGLCMDRETIIFYSKRISLANYIINNYCNIENMCPFLSYSEAYLNEDKFLFYIDDEIIDYLLDDDTNILNKFFNAFENDFINIEVNPHEFSLILVSTLDIITFREKRKNNEI